MDGAVTAVYGLYPENLVTGTLKEVGIICSVFSDLGWF